MRRFCLLFLAVILTAAAASAQTAAPLQDTTEPMWSFEGVLPMVFEVYDPVPIRLYTDEGHVLSDEEIAASLDLRVGDPAVLIRAGAVVGEGKVSAVVARKHPEARNGRVLYVQVAGLPEGVTFPDEPRGHAALLDADYDLLVITDKPVDVLAPDPLFEEITWGQQDYVVRVGRVRYAVIRENDPRQDGFRGWQVSKLAGTKSTRMTADYTWWPR
ncbi:MAG: hypothetical protein R3D98_11175 [Candidatus Krumholzibacteriia bacterium]